MKEKTIKDINENLKNSYSFLILFEIKYLIDIQKTVNQQQELKKRLIQKDPFFIKFKKQLIILQKIKQLL